MNNTERLTEELRRQAQVLPDQHPITLADVQGRARGIRRRRYAASGLAAAAVLAVTVLLGLAAGDRLDRTSTGPVDRPSEGRSVIEGVDPTPHADLDPTPAPELPRRVALTSETAIVGSPPQLPYLTGSELVLPDGAVVTVDGSYDVLLPLGDGFVVGGDAGNGERFAALLDASGREVWSEPSAGGPVPSPSGRLAAYGRVDGTTLVVGEDGERQELTTTRPEEFEVAAVFDLAGSCEGDDPQGGCTVYSNSRLDWESVRQSPGEVTRGGVTRRGEVVDDLTGHVEAVSPDHHLARSVSADGTGGLCSSVDDPDGRRLWETCDRQLGQFAPDGRFVLGYPLEDGRGPRSVALLDARDGTVLREYAAQGRSDVFVRQAVWDADGSVLATVWDTDHWAVLRMTVEGVLSSVPVEGLDGADDPDAPPVFLAGAS